MRARCPAKLKASVRAWEVFEGAYAEDEADYFAAFTALQNALNKAALAYKGDDAAWLKDLDRADDLASFPSTMLLRAANLGGMLEYCPRVDGLLYRSVIAKDALCLRADGGDFEAKTQMEKQQRRDLSDLVERNLDLLAPPKMK